MNVDEFNKTYDANKRCYAIYRTANGDRLSGLLLDGVQTSVAGKAFVYVDAFTKRIPLNTVVEVKVGQPW